MKPDSDWEVENAADTITRAQEIRADTKLWPKVKKQLAKKANAAVKAAVEAGIKSKMGKAFPK